MIFPYYFNIPKWYEEDLNVSRDLVLSPDLDGLLSASLLKVVSKGNWKPQYMYDYNALYMTDLIKEDPERRIWLDIAVRNDEKAFNDHLSRKDANDFLSNSAINVNLINNTTLDTYIRKYPCSTSLLIWSIYDLPLPASDIGKFVILSIDNTFATYYSSKEMHRDNAIHHIRDVLGFPELIEFLDNHDISDFCEAFFDMNLKAELIMSKDGFLKTEMDTVEISKALGIDITVPDAHFNCIRRFDKRLANSKESIANENIFSLAYINEDLVVYSVNKDSEESKAS